MNGDVPDTETCAPENAVTQPTSLSVHEVMGQLEVSALVKKVVQSP